MAFSKYLTAVAMLFACGSVRADFSYQSSTKMTGGTMMQFAGMMGDRMKQAMDATVSVKGNKMAHATARMSSIVDLDAQTVTTVDFDNKTYWVMTFEQMKKMMDDAAANASANPQAPAFSDMKVSMKEGPGSREAMGKPTHEEVLTIDVTMTDPKSGQNSTMQVVSDMFLAKGVEGAGELREFQKKMAGKVAWAPGGMPMMNQPALTKAISEMYASGAKLDGMPLVTLISINGAMPGMPNAAAMGGMNSEAMKGALPPGLASVMAARMGRKKAAEDPSASGGSNSGALMEMTMEVTSTSVAPVDPNVFLVPSGYLKTDGPPARRGRMQR